LLAKKYSFLFKEDKQLVVTPLQKKRKKAYFKGRLSRMRQRKEMKLEEMTHFNPNIRD